ncbi:unnamed protein product [Thlaspi arvense]|uniref:DUF4283 domain-containing protein n=1 Tax=Thlaspi arvense TaxID=13288 RepID=A0AAU9RWS5_THLAR|nr:unnamed protein product [Thlaspi arvense]
MANRWLAAARSSGLNPFSAPAENSSNPPLLLPPDPPDPSHPLNLTNFPPLSSPHSPSSPLSPPLDSSLTAFVEPENVVLALPASHFSRPVVVNSSLSSDSTFFQDVAAVNLNSGILSTVPIKLSTTHSKGILSHPTLPFSSLVGNTTTSSSGCVAPVLRSEATAQVVAHQVAASVTENQTPAVNVSYQPPLVPSVNATNVPPLVNKATKTWAEKLKRVADRSLERLALIAFSPEGKPQVAIPDSVFQERDDLHKDFNICRFKGRPPTYTHIQNVLSHLWGKGQRLEIHLNAVNHSMLVRIPNEFIRNKVIQKKLWYIGECMFLVAKWDSSGGASQDLDAIPILAHLKGMPFNLMHRKGISLVAGLIGDPKERDEFTMNLVSLTEAHVKVEANLNNPLPSSVEVFRDDRSVINIDVVYPWVPPTCSNCNMLGHVIRFCPSLPLPSATARPSGLKKNTEKDKGKGKAS